VEPTAAGYPATYPATFEVDPADRITNWKPLVQWLLAVPHYLVLRGLEYLSGAVAVISWFAIVFTGRLPEGLASAQHLYIRYANRTIAYVPQYEDRNRVTVGFRIILVIPHVIVLAVLWTAVAVVVIVWVFVVLFTGRWTAGVRDFFVGVMRWNTRVSAYFLLLTDEYPPFSLD
jgi:Domain of unknown function (DUF4389)